MFYLTKDPMSYPTFPAQVRFFFLILASLCFILEAILRRKMFPALVRLPDTVGLE
jgi:hypothetical protein